MSNVSKKKSSLKRTKNSSNVNSIEKKTFFEQMKNSVKNVIKSESNKTNDKISSDSLTIETLNDKTKKNVVNDKTTSDDLTKQTEESNEVKQNLYLNFIQKLDERHEKTRRVRKPKNKCPDKPPKNEKSDKKLENRPNCSKNVISNGKGVKTKSDLKTNKSLKVETKDPKLKKPKNGPKIDLKSIVESTDTHTEVTQTEECLTTVYKSMDKLPESDVSPKIERKSEDKVCAEELNHFMDEKTTQTNCQTNSQSISDEQNDCKTNSRVRKVRKQNDRQKTNNCLPSHLSIDSTKDATIVPIIESLPIEETEDQNQKVLKIETKSEDKSEEQNVSQTENCEENGPIVEDIPEMDKNTEITPKSKSDKTNITETPTNGCVRRSNRVRKATDLYSSKDINKSNKQKKCEKSELMSDTNKSSPKSKSKSTKNTQKSTKKSKSVSRKGIGKLLFDYRNRNRIPDYQKRLKYVEKDPSIDILHKMIGLVSTRLSDIPESKDEF